jgi:PAS domain S-box-containing protein
MAQKPTFEELEKKVQALEQLTSEQRRRETALRKSEKQLKDFIHSAPLSFMLFDSDLKIIQANKAHVEMFFPEMNPKDLMGKNLIEIFPNLKKIEKFDKFMKVIETGTPFYYDDIVPHPGPGNRYLAVKVFKMADGLGTIIVDITERKQAKKALKESEDWHRNFLENLSDVVFEADNSGNITYANKIAESITGVPLKDILKKPFLPLFVKKSQEIAVDVYQRTLNGESPRYELTLKNGKILNFKNKPLKNKNGKIIGVFGVARDVTALRTADEMLKKSNERLEKKVKIRTAELKDRNIALKVLLNQLKNDKKKMEKTITSNIRKLIAPNLERLKKSASNEKQKSGLALIEANLNEITSPFELSLSSEYLKLTPTEIQVANFIRQHATSKEIASALDVSRKTIDTHRQNIRKKIGIRGKGVNLKTYLDSLGHGT